MFWPLPFFGKYPFWFDYVAQGNNQAGPQIVYVSGFRDTATEFSLGRKLFAESASCIYMTSLPQHGRQTHRLYPRGYISMTMMNAYCRALAREIDIKCGNCARHNNMPIVLCGHSMGVTTLMWTLHYLPRDLLPHVSIMGIAPAFHVDHNVSRWVRFSAHFLRYYPGTVSDTFDYSKVTDARSVHMAIETSTLIYKGSPYLPFLYVASRLGHEGWWNVLNSQTPMYFIHGEGDTISPMPSYTSVQSHCVNHKIFPGQHYPMMQRNKIAQRAVRRSIEEGIRWCVGETCAAGRHTQLLQKKFRRSWIERIGWRSLPKRSSLKQVI